MLKKHLLGATLVIAMAIAAIAQPVAAGYLDQPPPLPGWVHAPKNPADTSGLHGIRLEGGLIGRGSPVIAEVDGNTGNGKEVVVGGADGVVHVYKADGSRLWKQSVPDAGCADHTKISMINGRATVGTLAGGSTPYVLIGYGTIENTKRACDGGVVVFRGTDGQQAWNFSLQNFESQTPEGPEDLHGVIGAPTLADSDGDGKLEVAFGGLDRNVYLLNSDGSVRWFYHAADTVWASPLFMNVDADAPLELVVATDVSVNPNVIPPTQNGGFLHAFDTASLAGARIPFQTGFIWRTFFDQALYSSPLGADLLPNNPGLEIALGASCYFGGATKNGRWVKIVSPATGAVLQTLNAPGCVQSSPAAGDIDDDGQLEVVATVNGSGNGGDGKSRIVAWDPTNPSPKWEKIPGDPNSGSNDPDGGDLQSAVIADLDGNGSLEVLAANFWSVHVLSGKDGSFLTHQGPNTTNLPSLFAWYTLKGTPAVGDIDGDGDLDVVIGGSNYQAATQGYLYAWTNFAGVISSPAGTQGAYSAPWPQLLRNAQGRALALQPGLTASTTTIGTLIEAGKTRQYRLTIGSADGGSISPRLGGGSDPSDIVSASLDGSTLTIDLSAAGKAAGSYSATVVVESPGLPALTINVALRVADSVTNVNLPVVLR